MAKKDKSSGIVDKRFGFTASVSCACLANVRGDAAVLGQAADAAILVVEANGTRRGAKS